MRRQPDSALPRNVEALLAILKRDGFDRDAIQAHIAAKWAELRSHHKDLSALEVQQAIARLFTADSAPESEGSELPTTHIKCPHCHHPMSGKSQDAWYGALLDHASWVNHAADRHMDPHFEDQRREYMSKRSGAPGVVSASTR